MGIKTDKLNKSFTAFIAEQPLFFVATAAAKGRVNVSPKGMDTLRILSDQKIVWLSLTGSGNETAAHLLQNPRMTLMFCAFKGDHLILRTYGTATVIHPRDADWADLYALFPDYAGARNIFVLDIDLVTTSCGSGVPEMSMVRSRGETDMEPFFADMGPEKVEAFWKRKNTKSLDGLPTGISGDIDREIAADRNFDLYSPALLDFGQSHGNWNHELLDDFLRSPDPSYPVLQWVSTGARAHDDRMVQVRFGPYANKAGLRVKGESNGQRKNQPFNYLKGWFVILCYVLRITVSSKRSARANRPTYCSRATLPERSNCHG